MPTKVELLRCAECGYTLTREKFSEICFAQSFGKDNYIGLIEDGKCPGCCEGALEDISLADLIAAWNRRADRNEIIEECLGILNCIHANDLHEVLQAIDDVRALKEDRDG